VIFTTFVWRSLSLEVLADFFGFADPAVLILETDAIDLSICDKVDVLHITQQAV